MCKYCWQLCWQLLKCFPWFPEANTMVPNWKELDLEKQILKLHCGFTRWAEITALQLLQMRSFYDKTVKRVPLIRLFFQISVQSYCELSETKRKKKKKKPSLIKCIIGNINKLENISEKPEIIAIFSPC